MHVIILSTPHFSTYASQHTHKRKKKKKKKLEFFCVRSVFCLVFRSPSAEIFNLTTAAEEAEKGRESLTGEVNNSSQVTWVPLLSVTVNLKQIFEIQPTNLIGRKLLHF